MSNPTFTARQKQEIKFREKQIAQAKFQEALSNSDKLQVVSIDFIYKKKLGSTLPITVNGVTISVPVNGKQYRVPECFADRIAAIKKQLNLEEQRNSKTFQNEVGDLSPTGAIPALGA